MKSCRRVPTARTTSAAAATTFADEEPVIPSGPACRSWECGTSVRPAVVSTSGIPCRSAKSRARCPAPEYRTPPPSTSNGRFEARRTPAASVTDRRSGRGRSGRCVTGSNSASGKSYVSAWTSCGSARTTGPLSAGSVSTRATCGNVEISCSGRVIRSK